jgi:hypothetical protein
MKKWKQVLSFLAVAGAIGGAIWYNYSPDPEQDVKVIEERGECLFIIRDEFGDSVYYRSKNPAETYLFRGNLGSQLEADLWRGYPGDTSFTFSPSDSPTRATTVGPVTVERVFSPIGPRLLGIRYNLDERTKAGAAFAKAFTGASIVWFKRKGEGYSAIGMLPYTKTLFFEGCVTRARAAE